VLRKIWNKEKPAVAPWWRENLKFAFESGFVALAARLKQFSEARTGMRALSMGFPNFESARSRRSSRFWAAHGLSVVDDRHIAIPTLALSARRK
jgi:putative transposase